MAEPERLYHIEALNTKSVRAEAVLAALPARVHRVVAKVTLADERAQVVSIVPQFVDVILELLAQVEKEPSLVLVSLSLAGHEPDSYLLPLEVLAPEGLRVELVPAEVGIVLAEDGSERPSQEVR